MKTKIIVISVLSALTTLTVSAKPTFFLPEHLYAAPGVECNVYFSNIFESFTPGRYAYEALAKQGKSQVERWTWTPTEADAGTEVKLVINAWSDDAPVASVTTTVHVARAPQPGADQRKITFALLAASLTNSRYQDRIMKDMRENGYPLFTPVGSRPSAEDRAKDPARAAHDGYGGFSFDSFLTRFAMTVDEIDNLQSEAEKEQLRKFGVKLDGGQKWRKSLLRSPLVAIRNGEKVLDVQGWLDRVNGGAAPNFIVIELGVNGTFGQREATLDDYIRDEQIAKAKQLVAALRTVAPEAIIGICTEPVGCGQDGYGQNYAASISLIQGRRNIFRISRALKTWVESAGDPKLVLVPLAQSIDPVYGFIRTSAPANACTTEKKVRDHNALHPALAGGYQLGDAIYAWLANTLSR